MLAKMTRLFTLSLPLVLLASACTETAPPPPEREVDAGTGGGTDAGAPTDAGPPAEPSLCPPSGPFGSNEGDVAPDVRLMDCDGVEHSLHELCENDAVWIFEFADWCPPCRSFARNDVNRIYQSYQRPGFEGWMVISAASDGSLPDATLCEEVRSRYGIDMPVLYDPNGDLQRQLDVPSNEINIVLRRGAIIDWVGQYAANQVESRIGEVLAD